MTSAPSANSAPTLIKDTSIAPSSQTASTLSEALLRRIDREESLAGISGYGILTEDVQDWREIYSAATQALGDDPGLRLLDCKLRKWVLDQETDGKYDRPDDAIQCLEALLSSTQVKGTVRDTAAFWLLEYELRTYESDVPFELHRSDAYLYFAVVNTSSTFLQLAQYKAVFHSLEAAGWFDNPDQRSDAPVTAVTDSLRRVRPVLVDLLNQDIRDPRIRVGPANLKAIDQILANPELLEKR